MPIKNIFTTAILALSLGCTCAQQKNSASTIHKDKGFTFFPADSTVQPAAASVIVYSQQASGEMPDRLIAILNKKGIAVAKPEPGNTAIDKIAEYLQDNASLHKKIDQKIGVLIFGKPGNLPLNLNAVGFTITVNSATALNSRIPGSAPLLIVDNNANGDGWLTSYSKRNKAGFKTDIYLHQHRVSDSIQQGEIISWMDSQGFLKPISNEKTYTQKRQQDWANFMKVIDDRLHNDWAWLTRYEDDNNKMRPPAKDEKRVIFLGNSITEGWINQDPEFFKSHDYINRGIGGQTTPQMLVRFREDVVNLRPHVVIILAGTNDIAQNTGPSKIENVAGNIISMAEIAKANGIKVILCTVLPASSFPWHPGIDPIPTIVKLNGILKEYAGKNQLGFVDYYSAVVDDKKGLKKELAIDGLVHPNRAGYKVMEPLAEAAINKALAEK